MSRKEFQTLCSKSLTGEISEEQQKLLNDLMGCSEKDTKEFERMKILWNKIKIPEEIDNHMENDWRRLMTRIENDKKRKKISLMDKLFGKMDNRKWKPVFVAIPIMVAVIITILFIQKNNKPDRLITIATSNTEIRKIHLPDGSSVTLNGKTVFSYKEFFGEPSRDVTLSGEALFEVKHDGRPFVINTLNAKTIVLGTKLNVWSRTEITKVTVKEGKVKVCDKMNKGSVFLIRNQQSVVAANDKPTTPKMVDSDFLSGWTQNKLVFSNTSLSDVVEDLQRYYGKNIISKGIDFGDYTLTGSFNNRDMDSVMTMICLALDLKYQKSSEGYIIKLR